MTWHGLYLENSSSGYVMWLMHFGKIVKKNANQLSFEPKRVIGIAEIPNDYTFIKSYIFSLDDIPFQ